jgi:hypothetical protein
MCAHTVSTLCSSSLPPYCRLHPTVRDCDRTDGRHADRICTRRAARAAATDARRRAHCLLVCDGRHSARAGALRSRSPAPGGLHDGGADECGVDGARRQGAPRVYAHAGAWVRCQAITTTQAIANMSIFVHVYPTQDTLFGSNISDIFSMFSSKNVKNTVSMPIYASC